MSNENLEVVKRVWEATESRDTEALFRLYDPAIVWESCYGPLSGVYHGHEGVRQFFRDWMESIDDFQAHAETFIDKGDAVVVGLRITGRGRGSGVEIDMPQGHVYKVRNGLIVYVGLHETEAAALNADAW
jgi:ketosteroid isomerase-like protein